MNEEYLKNIADEKHEPVPLQFPIFHMEAKFYGDDTPELKENVVVHYIRSGLSGRELHQFKLLKVISGLHYIFSLGESFDRRYSVSFKTEEYEYAVTNLSEAARDELGQTLASFINTVTSDGGVPVEGVNIHPADASYTSAEIEECIAAIVASPDNTLTQEEIREGYKGFEVFDLYEEIYKKNFHDEHYNRRSKARARSRYFKGVFKKYLPNWEMEDDPLGFDFTANQKTDISPQ